MGYLEDSQQMSEVMVLLYQVGDRGLLDLLEIATEIMEEKYFVK